MPVEIVEVSTNYPDVAHQTLNEIYVPDRPIKYFGSGERFEFRLRAMQAGQLHGGRFRHTMATRADVAPFQEFLACVLLSGGIQWPSGRERLALRRGDVVRYPTTAGSDTAWSEFELALVRIPMTAVEQAAQAHTGIGAGQLSFEGMAPVSPVMARQWRALFPLCAPVAGRA